MATKSLSIRIDETMLHKLHVLADYEGRSANSQILILIRDAVEEYEKKLGLAARYRALGDEAQRCLDALNRVQGSDGDDAHLSAARQALENIINER